MRRGSQPRIGIDFHVAGGIYQGVRTYLANLIPEILKQDLASRYFVYTNLDTVSEWQQRHPNLAARSLPTDSGRLNLLAGFPWLAYRDHLSLFHSQYVLPVHLPCRSVLTIHDILFESHPEFFPPFHRWLLKRFIPFSARRATMVISVSEFTKKELVKYYRVPEEKIAVIYEGASAAYAPVENKDLIAATLRRYKIHKKYILFVGRIEPRKNLTGILEGFDFVKKRGHTDVCLVIVGQQDKIFQESTLSEAVRRMGLSSDVLFTGGVSEKDLAILYNGALVLAYPAFAEGFGLPVLEAMACGTPVITSNTTSLPEVVGDAAVLINPQDHGEIARSLEQVLADEALRRALSAKGLKRSETFTWEKAAQQTVQVYAKVLGAGNPG